MSLFILTLDLNKPLWTPPLVDLYDVHLQLTQTSNNNRKTKKKIIKSKKLLF
jgi:hypothetical protein